MSIIKPGCDTKHIIQQVMNSKSLATLAQEEDTYQARKNAPVTETVSEQRKGTRGLYTKQDLADFIQATKGKSSDEVFELLGIKVKHNEDGTKTISHYKWPFGSYSFQSAQINEEELLKDVKEIRGYCDLVGSSAKTLGGVTKIGGDIRVPLFTKAEDLSHIKTIGGSIICESEDPEDANRVIEKIKLKPEHLGHGINPPLGSNYYPFFSLPNGITKDIRMMSYINSLK